MTRRVLVVEDNRDLGQLLELHLGDLGCSVTLAHDGPSGWQQAERGGFDLLVLDLMLPGFDGLELCRRVRAAAQYTPILMLTSKSTELDRVLGLEMGADDYVAKPFSLLELMARIKALFRRSEALSSGSGATQHELARFGDLTIDCGGRTARLRNQPLDLTAREFDLLCFFTRHPGRVYSRAQLLDAVWGLGYDGYEHTVNSHINRLRSKLEDDPQQPNYILTVWGVGYKFNETLAR